MSPLSGLCYHFQLWLHSLDTRWQRWSLFPFLVKMDMFVIMQQWILLRFVCVITAEFALVDAWINVLEFWYKLRVLMLGDGFKALTVIAHVAAPSIRHWQCSFGWYRWKVSETVTDEWQRHSSIYCWLTDRHPVKTRVYKAYVCLYCTCSGLSLGFSF